MPCEDAAAASDEWEFGKDFEIELMSWENVKLNDGKLLRICAFLSVIRF